MKISGRQIAAARGLLAWSQGHLAQAADVGIHTIVRWELQNVEPRRETVEKVRRAIEARGVEFTNGGQPGVRFKAKPEAAEPESASE
jgi:DNA-binding XRE family transcriptional regulator